MVASQIELAGPVARYARILHGVIGDGHQVASPLGAWLLLALCGPASNGQARATLTAALGCDVDQAARMAAALLASPHPLVAAAAAVWSEPGRISDQWLSGLPGAVATGIVPSQAELDGWARRNTYGLIDRFPIQVDASVYLILATALATRVSWEYPFELAPASALGPASLWSQRLSQVLRTPAHVGHAQFIAATPEAGDVAVQVASAQGGLLVMSVVAAPDRPSAEVLATAYRLAMTHAAGGQLEQRSLFDLPLGEGQLWSVLEETAVSGGRERCTAVLPAWSAQSTHDLRAPDLGFTAAAAAVAGPGPWEAKQAAMARYSRIGFEAAAVTAVARASARAPYRGPVRTAELRFGHPFAVVAVTVDEHLDAALGRVVRGPWHGVPVFSAWVTAPEDAEEADPPA